MPLGCVPVARGRRGARVKCGNALVPLAEVLGNHQRPPRRRVRQVMEYWESEIVPEIRAGKRVLIVSHANTIRALVKR